MWLGSLQQESLQWSKKIHLGKLIYWPFRTRCLIHNPFLLISYCASPPCDPLLQHGGGQERHISSNVMHVKYQVAFTGNWICHEERMPPEEVSFATKALTTSGHINPHLNHGPDTWWSTANGRENQEEGKWNFRKTEEIQFKVRGNLFFLG